MRVVYCVCVFLLIACASTHANSITPVTAIFCDTPLQIIEITRAADRASKMAQINQRDGADACVRMSVFVKSVFDAEEFTKGNSVYVLVRVHIVAALAGNPDRLVLLDLVQYTSRLLPEKVT